MMNLFSVTFSMIILSFSSLLNAEICEESIKSLCGKAAKPMKCLESKKSSLPMKCRVSLEENKKVAASMDPACMKAINSACKLDIKALMKDQKGYMKKYQACVVKNQKKFAKACKGMDKMLSKKYDHKKKK